MVNPEVRCTIITLNDDDEFLVFSKAPDDGVAADRRRAWSAMMLRAVGAELPIEIIGHWPWTAGVALVAERFIAGRVMLAGDAAHLFTPTGGFGMNTGMDDASNLAWKLAALVQGWGGANLLQSYEIERKPIAERNTVAARELNKHLANMPADRPRSSENSPAGEAARREVSAHLADHGRGIRLDRRAARRALRRLADHRRGRRAASRRLPALHAVRRAGRPRAALLADAGPRLWRLAVRPARRGLHAAAARRQGAGHRSIEAAAHRRGVPLTVIDVPQADARELYGRDLALIRPDQYVAWRGNAPPADPDRLIGALVGAT